MQGKKKIALNSAFGKICRSLIWDGYRAAFKLLPKENEKYPVEIKHYEIRTGMLVAPVTYAIYDSLKEAESAILIERLSE